MVKYAAQKKHDQQCTKFCFKFHNEKDKEVIEALKNADNKTDYVRDLIITDILKRWLKNDN